MKSLVCGVALVSAFAVAKASEPVTLVLDSQLTQSSSVVQLHDRNNCIYVGKVQQGGGEKDAVSTNLLHSTDMSNSTWSISVGSKDCGGEKTAVSLIVPIRNMYRGKDYNGGEKLNAHPTK